MSFDKFLLDVNNILKTQKIENIKINNIDIIRNIITDKNIMKKIYSGFEKNYKLLYGNDLSNYTTKLNDFLYRVNLLVNYNIVDKFEIYDENMIKDVIEILVDNNSVELFDSVDYNIFDMEIVEDQDLEVRNALISKKI